MVFLASLLMQRSMPQFVGGLYTYSWGSFATVDANKVVREPGPGGLECWRRLTSSTQRAAILGSTRRNPCRLSRMAAL